LFAGNFGAASIFSTAFETMKFLSDTSPIIGFSSFLGTGTFLGPYLSYFFTSGKTNVPVPFSLKVFASGLAAPLGRPNVALGAFSKWLPEGAYVLPIRFETPGFEVVVKQKVLAVGAAFGSYFE
jgi:hypothetical protein